MFRSLFLFILALPLFLTAQSYPSKPINYVTDEARVLNDGQKQALNAKLRNFETSSSNQIFIYIAPSLNGRNLEVFSQELFHNWQIGTQKHDNGVLIAVFVNDHKFRIQTGYGMEGNLTDLLTKKIQDETMRPYFKQNDFYTGFDKGVDELIYYSAHDYEAEHSQVIHANLTGWLLGYIPNLLLLSLFTYLLYRKKQHHKRRPAMKHVLFAVAFLMALIPCFGFIILFFMLMLVTKLKSSTGSGSYSSGSSSWMGSDSGYSSSSSDYSSSSSDFSGGGGGDSGGGGSSSDW